MGTIHQAAGAVCLSLPPCPTHRAPPFFCFHTINSFEEGDDLHVDLCGYDDVSLIRVRVERHLALPS